MSGAATVDNLVIGGGLAGAMTALRLAHAGREVLLVEKERTAHHKVCGEFLSPEAVEYLQQAGIDPLQLGGAPVHLLRFSARSRVVETPLPFRAVSLSRCVLDEALLTRAEKEGCVVRRGVAVQGLCEDEPGCTAKLSDGKSQHARAVFLATGKHDLRGWHRPAGVQGDLVGFKLHWRLREPQVDALRGFMDLFLFHGGYGGLALVEGDAANLCLVVRRSTLRGLGGWSELLAALLEDNPLMASRLAGAEALWERPLAVSSIPYGYLSAASSGVWRVGDQAAVIPSFTGDGMAIAMHSGVMAAEMYLEGKSPQQYHHDLALQLKNGMCVATLLSRAMVSAAGRLLAPSAITFLPAAIRWIASSTRIPKAALRPVLSR